MTIERSKRPVGAARLAALARRLLDASTVCAVSSVTPRGRAYVNAAYFAWSSDLQLVWLSDPRASHSRNVHANPSVAIAVYDSNQTWGEPDCGIQLFGAAHESVGRAVSKAARLYEQRFPGYRSTDLSEYRFYGFRPRRIKVFDEPSLGPGVFVTASVGSGGRINWEKTEVYRPGA